METPPPNPSRRSLLLAGLAAGPLAALLAACGEDDPGGSAGGASTTVAADQGYQLIEVFPRSPTYVAAGTAQRLPYLIAPGVEAPLDHIEGPVTFTVKRKGQQVGEPVVVDPAGGGELPRSYLPLRFTFPEPDIYDISAKYDGQTMKTALQAGPASLVKLPQVGAPLPPVDTPTVDDHRGVDPICTADAQCPFHTVNLADSLKAGRPVLVLVSTPRFCVSAVCGPVLDVLTEAATGRTDIDVVHVEPYANPTQVDSIAQATPSPLVTAYSMEFEPALFAANGAGVLVDRLDAIYDRNELDRAITAALA
jgi:hypothetical protein